MKLITTCILLTGVIFANDFYYSNGKVVNLKKLESRDNRNIYLDDYNSTLEVTNRILVKFKNSADIDRVLKEYNLTKLDELLNNLLLVSTIDNPIDISNRLYKLDEIKYAHPDFKREKRKRTLDPFFSKAWHLENTAQESNYKKGADINVTSAWSYTKGSGVKVGIVDDGFDIYHEDLSENFLEGYNSAYKDSDVLPTESEEKHGTACMGLIVAKENNLGSVGVAPQSKIYAVKDNAFTADLIKGFQWLESKGVEVISNSWGTYHVEDAFVEALNDLATNGRNGKGVVILFAVGNDNKDLDSSGYDDESELDSVIGVGASSEFDTKTSYSNYGSNVDILAPGSEYSSIVTTDRTGDSGYSSSSDEYPNYTFSFDGTSAATPVTAGVVALMLSVNSDLTRDEVQEILQLEAVKIGSDEYINGRNLKYAYGRIDAGSSVKRAYNLKNNIVALSSGWNLVSNPTDIGYFTSNIKFDSIWEYKNSSWIQNTTTLEAKSGIWIHSSSNIDIQFTGTNYKFDINSMEKGVWILSGTGESFNTNKYNFESIWRYYRGYWEQNPKTILKGEGFWLKLKN